MTPRIREMVYCKTEKRNEDTRSLMAMVGTYKIVSYCEEEGLHGEPIPIELSMFCI